MNLAARVRQDALLNRVLVNSAHLFSSNSIALALSVIQGILATRLLGLTDFGLLALVMAYASSVNGFFSFRMSELVVRYGGEYLEKGEHEKTGALIKAASLTETAVSVLAFLAVAATAGLATHYFIKTPGTEWMVVLYSIGLLANFNTETSTGILQITDKVRLRGVVNLLQTVLSVSIIGAAFLLNFSSGTIQNSRVLIVLIAYLTGKSVLGLGLFAAAQFHLRRVLGRGWTKAPLSVLPSTRELLKFAVSSNLSATAILVFRSSEILWVGYFLTKDAAGLYKNAYTLVEFLSVPADPLILAVFPEINRLVVQKAWPNLRSFLKKITTLSFGYNALIAAGYILLGRWMLALYGPRFPAAYPTMIILLAGLAFNYTLFWNRPLLLSFGLPTFPLWATLIAGVVKVGLSFLLVPRYGYAMEAALLSFYYVLSVGLIVWRGLIELRKQERPA